ncbi:hypothetical protein S83_003923, partial [Arachis hypogaea]
APPPKGEDDPLVSAGSCGSSCRASTHDCTPIAMSVVSSVSEMKSDIRKLSEAIARHDAVVSEIKDAIKLLTGHRSRGLSGEPVGGICRACKCSLKRSGHKVTKENEVVKKSNKTCRQGGKTRPPVSGKVPAIDTSFTVDHIPFTSNRTKKARRKPFTSRQEPRAKHIPEVVDLSSDDGVAKTREKAFVKTVTQATGPSVRHKFHADAADSVGIVNLSGLLSIQVESISK